MIHFVPEVGIKRIQHINNRGYLCVLRIVYHYPVQQRTRRATKFEMTFAQSCCLNDLFAGATVGVRGVKTMF